ncbi:MAG: phospho-N-acetylmuramoyl-pentapeptide-transferase [Armatimonadetes bacterium]|nr:phospho-N-acetylmuramoyl-pentapeptide-transferase [Armatimonadota bacterium]
MSEAAALSLWLRLVLAGIGAAAIVVAAGPRTVSLLAAWGHRQRIREDAPARHQTKAGTPTMGGLLIITAIVVAALATSGAHHAVLFAIAALAGFGAIGLWDDLLAGRRDRNLGLRARERLALQGAVGLVLGWAAARAPWVGTDVTPPFVGTFDLGGWYIPFAALLFVGFANAVNLTDGLDGLAAGLAALAGLGFVLLAIRGDQPEVGMLAVAMVGASFAFLTMNAHPARVFMGDVGSNALGALLAALAIVTKAEFILFVFGAIFVAEAASVLLQVAYFKATGGRRIFRMSPLHHHFELAGWPEAQIVRRFYLAGSACLVLGLLVGG